MRTIKGPALLIAQLASDHPPFNSLPAIAKWAAGLGYKGLHSRVRTPAFSTFAGAPKARPTPTRSPGP